MSQSLPNVADSSPNLKALLDAYERRLIQTALIATRGNQRQAARSLGLLPTTLHEKMKRLGLFRRPLHGGTEASGLQGAAEAPSVGMA